MGVCLYLSCVVVVVVVVVVIVAVRARRRLEADWVRGRHK